MQPKLRKSLKNKLIAFAIILIAVLLLINDFTVVDVDKTALIEAVGVDYEDGIYKVVCQVAIPSAGDSPTEKPALVESDGKSVAEAISNFHSATGWTAKLDFCSVLILGQGTTDDITDALDFFFFTERFNDNCLVGISSLSAKSILEKNQPLDDMSGYALAKILSPDDNNSENIISANLKNIMLGIESKSDSYLLPKIHAETDGPIDASEAYIVKNAAVVGSLTDGEVRAYNLLMTKSKKSVYFAENGAGIEIERKTSKIIYDIVNDRIRYAAVIRLTAKNYGTKTIGKSLSQSANTLHIPRETADAIESDIEKNIASMFMRVSESGSDFLKIMSKLHKFKTNDYERLITGGAEQLLSEADFSVEVEVKSL